MALFGIETPIFKCRKCDSVFFEEVEVKSYITDDMKVSEIESKKAIKCIECGEYHYLSDEYDIIDEEQA